MFDGVNGSVGGAGNSMVDYYVPIYETRKIVASPLIVDGTYTILGDQCTATFDIQVDLPVTTSDNRVNFYVAVEGLHGQSNMVTEILASEPFALTAVGETVAIERTFTVDPAWSWDDLRVIAVVQSGSYGEILQAGKARPDYKATVMVDCRPDGVAAGWRIVAPMGVEHDGAGDATVNSFFAGDFTIWWDDVPFWTSPPVNGFTVTVPEDGMQQIVGTYTDGPFVTVADGDLADPGVGAGVAAVDFDADGDLDLHVVNDGSADGLLRNDGGVFTALGSAALAGIGDATATAWADYNGDGHLDLYLGRDGQANQLLAGDGLGGFTPAAAFGLDNDGAARTVSWLDYDNDGLLDLYIVNEGSANVLLRSFGDIGGGTWLFSAQSTGADVTGNSLAGAWADIDFDGRLDLYVVNRFAANVLLMNATIGFSDVSATTGVADDGGGTGAAWGDYDNDGDWDLYVANDGSADRLYQAVGHESFNLKIGGNLGDRGHARGVLWVDLDNDMLLDLYVARHGEPDLMLMGNGDGTFLRVPVGPAEAEAGSNALSCGDFDQDGDVDIYVSRDGAANVLFDNAIASGNHWLGVDLVGPAGNPTAIGARVTLVAGGVSQMRQVTAGSGYLCQEGGPAHFGLAGNTYVSEVRVTWPDGLEQTVGPLQADTMLTIEYGLAPSGTGGNVPAPATALGRARPNPFNPSTTIDYSLARTGRVRLDVYTVDGRRVATLVDGERAAGTHSAVWHGRDDKGRAAASGTYVYRLRTDDGRVRTGRMALVK